MKEIQETKLLKDIHSIKESMLRIAKALEKMEQVREDQESSADKEDGEA